MTGLIEMNARMVTTWTSAAVNAIGIIAVVAFVLLAIVSWLMVERRRGLVIGLCVALALAGVGVVIYANAMPKVREIHYCANGPVSLEQIAAVYEIVKVDGKELVLRER